VLVFFSNDHARHAPDAFIMRGQRRASPEIPQRATILLDAVREDSHETRLVKAPQLDAVRRVHDAGYLTFVQSAWSRWSELPDHADEILPNVHPGRNMGTRPDHIIGQAGFYQTDTACPIGPGTWDGALASAECAIEATQAVLSGDVSASYALCRPPGHHAYADMAGGFCFLNNSAIAAQLARDSGMQRVAIIDVDVHHGNGTQGIFYDRSDVLTISLHGDPAGFYPFFAGYADETGTGEGIGFNHNVPLGKGVADDDYMPHLDACIERVNAFAPEIVIVAAGLDASENDPLAWLGITTDGFARIGARLGATGLPTVLVQEGGYISDELGNNLRAFLSGFTSTRTR